MIQKKYYLFAVTIEEVCQSTADSGPCGNYEDMYYYDSFSGRCHLFIYGGCGGNLNRFKTREECEARCSHVGINRRNCKLNWLSLFFFQISFISFSFINKNKFEKRNEDNMVVNFLCDDI